MKVVPIKFDDVREWLTHKHYARRVASVSYAFGLYDEQGHLKGICTFGVPASPFLCRGICGDEYRHLVIEFNRLCISEPHERNIGSIMLSKAMKQLPRPLILVSYADISQGHVGYIYQATNWIYTGLSQRASDRMLLGSTMKHARHNNVYESKGEWVNIERSRKHRYVMFLGSKKQKKELLAALRYPILPYPKGESLRYDASHRPVTQMRMF